MYFNSFNFIFIFLPICITGYFLIINYLNNSQAVTWLVISSLLFYGWCNFNYLPLLMLSMLVNYIVGGKIRGCNHGSKQKKSRKRLLIVGIALNIMALAYFKYFMFTVDTINIVLNSSITIENIIFPLAISFFTFQQIAYLVDSYRNEAHADSFSNYCLFVTFFPQLIAGPIVRYQEMMPQFKNISNYRFNTHNFNIGITIFILGLSKKVIIADGLASFATPIFSTAAQNGSLTFIEAWTGALAYTFQIYFDFSGYTDMAIGLARIFSIRLPTNFNSPYKANSIIDFWQRWHITLSRFLRDYLYFPMGGNRYGPLRQYRNLLATMLLGGLWHGAGWTFVLWGALHGAYLTINHAWRTVYRKIGNFLPGCNRLGTTLSKALTFFSVVIAWVIFRANDIPTAKKIIESMLNPTNMGQVLFLNFPERGSDYRLISFIFKDANFMATYGDSNIYFMNIFLCRSNQAIILIAISMALAFFSKNSNQIVKNMEDATTIKYSVFAGVVFVISILGMLSETPSEFLYSQF